jgi:hypothetical protein
MNIGKLIGAAVLSSLVAMLGGCYIPFASEARDRAWHERQRGTPESQAYIREQLASRSCFQLGEWERLVLYRLNPAYGPALSVWSPKVLTSDLGEIRRAMETRHCPTYREMLAEGTPAPVPGRKLAFACVCWVPVEFSPAVKEGPGPAGPGCETVRAELSPGTFVFFERSRLGGEWSHEISNSPGGTVLGSLDAALVWTLLKQPHFGIRHSSTDNDETDGWLAMQWGYYRILTDDCRPLSPEAASIAERTIIRWMTEPTN